MSESSQKTGHYAVVCCSCQTIHTVTQDTSYSVLAYAFLGEVEPQTTRLGLEKVHLNGETINFKVTTGGDVTSIPQSA